MNVYRVEWLAFALNETWTFLHHQVEGLTGVEFFWEPVPDCWTVRLEENGRWSLDYADPAPDPPPFATIA